MTNADLNETLDDILEAISETACKIMQFETPEKIQSLSFSAALLAVTYKMLESSAYDDDEEDEEVSDDK